ncbi:uncharacterized protein LOC103519281 isoform X2 [Diaphorina citri]|uniref:Uncharacterized protein LOC103519281 isoform X2 n=1 Tax=Diaphorina citri TaxID=121845 RepID=A0A3Q0JIQ5_DIACI|nr:uncharacterized protein LOC103519281 isoform X2 [Diaphorina citri]
MEISGVTKMVVIVCLLCQLITLVQCGCLPRLRGSKNPKHNTQKARWTFSNEPQKEKSGEAKEKHISTDPRSNPSNRSDPKSKNPDPKSNSRDPKSKNPDPKSGKRRPKVWSENSKYSVGDSSQGIKGPKAANLPGPKAATNSEDRYKMRLTDKEMAEIGNKLIYTDLGYNQGPKAANPQGPKAATNSEDRYKMRLTDKEMAEIGNKLIYTDLGYNQGSSNAMAPYYFAIL